MKVKRRETELGSIDFNRGPLKEMKEEFEIHVAMEEKGIRSESCKQNKHEVRFDLVSGEGAVAAGQPSSSCTTSVDCDCEYYNRGSRGRQPNKLTQRIDTMAN